METGRPLFIPVILGTARMGRMSLHAARLVTEELGKRGGVETDLIDIAKLPLPTNDAGEAIKQADFSAKMTQADALVVVSPEYNHGYSGLLKHVLDSCLKEYIHKAVGIVGVSAGPFGGTRVIQNLLPVMREIGLVTIFWDVNFSSVQKVFAEDGKLLDESYIRRIDKFLKELIWMATTLRQGREQISLDRPTEAMMATVASPEKMTCPSCKVEMNHHCDKVLYNPDPPDSAPADSTLGGFVAPIHTCPECGGSATGHA
jgi:NAD(P)H-dependent FMN reductase